MSRRLIPAEVINAEDLHVEITNKDIQFYAPIYLKRLQNAENEIGKLIRLTENQMEKLLNNENLYMAQKKELDRYQQMLETNKEKQSIAMDEANEAFMRYVTSQLRIKEKQKITSIKKKENAQAKKQQEKACITKFYQTESKINRDTRTYDSYYRRMLKIDSEMPDYMRDALKNMPRNKGYIFRGVWYFGSKAVSPEQEEKYLTMFERVKGIQYIHEYVYMNGVKYYTLYEKLSKNSPKKVIREERYRIV